MQLSRKWLQKIPTSYHIFRHQLSYNISVKILMCFGGIMGLLASCQMDISQLPKFRYVFS